MEVLFLYFSGTLIRSEGAVSTFAKSHMSSDELQIATVRKAWIDAVTTSNVNAIIALVSDDVVVVRGNGQCVCGKDQLKREFHHFFELVDVQQLTASSEVTVRDHWAIEIDDVESTRATVGSDDMPMGTHFKAIYIFRNQADASWKIARLVLLSR